MDPSISPQNSVFLRQETVKELDPEVVSRSDEVKYTRNEQIFWRFFFFLYFFCVSPLISVAL